jgi:hypothetical protein
VQRSFAGRTIEFGGEMIGERFDRLRRVGHCLAAMIENLHRGADADREHECDDQDRNGAAQQRLGGEKAAIRGLGD